MRKRGTDGWVTQSAHRDSSLWLLSPVPTVTIPSGHLGPGKWGPQCEFWAMRPRQESWPEGLYFAKPSPHRLPCLPHRRREGCNWGAGEASFTHPGVPWRGGVGKEQITLTLTSDPMVYLHPLSSPVYLVLLSQPRWARGFPGLPPDLWQQDFLELSFFPFSPPCSVCCQHLTKPRKSQWGPGRLLSPDSCCTGGDTDVQGHLGCYMSKITHQS